MLPVLVSFDMTSSLYARPLRFSSSVLGALGVLGVLGVGSALLASSVFENQSLTETKILVFLCEIVWIVLILFMQM